jgi:hypothetical protein
VCGGEKERLDGMPMSKGLKRLGLDRMEASAGKSAREGRRWQRAPWQLIGLPEAEPHVLPDPRTQISVIMTRAADKVLCRPQQMRWLCGLVT